MMRKLFVAAQVEAELRRKGARLVVVGGTAVEWHTVGLYRSGDLDVLGPWDEVDRVLRSAGFVREGRHWFHEGLGVAVEAPAEHLDTYRDRTEEVVVEGATVTVLAVEEAILDRLRACVRWRSSLDCEQAVHMALVRRKDLDWTYIERRAVRDQVVEKLAETRKRAEAMA